MQKKPKKNLKIWKTKKKKNLKICITGGIGFIGYELIKKLNELGYTDILVVDEEDACRNRFMKECFFGKPYEVTFDTFMDYNTILETKDFSFIDDIDFCYHLGANSSTRALIKETFDSNICFTAELFKRAKCPIVFASSGAVYDSERKINPSNDYGITKLIGEKLAESHKNIVCLRYHNVYGANEKHKGDMGSLVYKWISNTESLYNHLFIGSKSIYRDFVHIQDVTKINVLFLETWLKFNKFIFLNDKNYYDVGSGQSVSFQDLSDEILKHTKKLISYIRNPYKSGYQFYTKANIKPIKKLYFLIYGKNLKTIKIKKGVKMVYNEFHKFVKHNL